MIGKNFQSASAIAGLLLLTSMISSGRYLYVIETNRGFVLRVDPRTGVITKLYAMSIDNREHNPIVGVTWKCDDLYAVEIFPLDNPWSTDTANLVRFDRRTGKRTTVLSGFASLPNGLVQGPDGALYTSNWGISPAALPRRSRERGKHAVTSARCDRRACRDGTRNGPAPTPSPDR